MDSDGAASADGNGSDEREPGAAESENMEEDDSIVSTREQDDRSHDGMVVVNDDDDDDDDISEEGEERQHDQHGEDRTQDRSHIHHHNINNNDDDDEDDDIDISEEDVSVADNILDMEIFDVDDVEEIMEEIFEAAGQGLVGPRFARGLLNGPLRGFAPDDDDDDDDSSSSSSATSMSSSETSSSSEDDSTDDDEDGHRIVTHYGVTCDECSSSPIRGNVYHSRRIIDYDICEECYVARHKQLTLRDAFLVFKKRKIHFREDGLFENPGMMRVNCYGWASLEDVLRNNPLLQNLDLNFTRRFRRHAEAQQPTEEGRQAIRAGLAESRKLKVIYAKFPATDWQGVHSQSIKALLNGIAASQSIITLNLTLDFTWQSAITDICDLIRNNRSIRFLFLQHSGRNSHRGPIVTMANALRNTVTNHSGSGSSVQQSAMETQMEQEDEIVRRRANDLFQALRETSIHSFVCKGVPDLGPECYDSAVAALKTRPSMKRIKVPFATGDKTKLEELDRLMQEKDEHWMKDWNDPNATTESRVQVLEEVLSCKQVDEQDQVAALFHFVRSNPGSLPELQQRQGA